jgi:hypothetical protein
MAAVLREGAHDAAAAMAAAASRPAVASPSRPPSFAGVCRRSITIAELASTRGRLWQFGGSSLCARFYALRRNTSASGKHTPHCFCARDTSGCAKIVFWMRDAEWDAAQLLLSSAAPGSVLTMRLGEVRVKAPQPKYDGDQFLYELAFDGVPAPGTFAVCAEGDDAPGIPPPVRIGDAAVGRVCDVAPVVGGAWAIRARLVLMKPRSGTAAPLACTFWDRGAQMTVKLWGTLATEFEARGEYMGAYEVRGCASELCLRPVSRAAAARRFWCPYEAHFDRDSALQEGTIEACADDSDVELPNWGMSFDDIPPTRRQPCCSGCVCLQRSVLCVST